MFRQGQNDSQMRVLIASVDAEERRRIGDIGRAAGLRAVGFIRDAEQLIPRTLLSMPNVLLLDMEMYHQLQAKSIHLTKLHNAGTIQILLCCHQLSTRAALQWKRDGIDGILDLANLAAQDVESLSQQLRSVLSNVPCENTPAPPVQQPAPVPVAVHAGTKRKTLLPNAVIVGSSTGGPMALMTMLKGLPADFPLPVAVVQHMPPGFTRMLAERLHAECAVRVVEAEAGMRFEAGTVYIAPGGLHMLLEGNPKSVHIELNTQLPENSCRPAVDVLFRSSARIYGGHQHTIVLTGMGRDGLLGATQLHGLQSRIVVQDAATSTVWGMPGAIAQAGFADDILPIDQIAPQLLRCL